MAPLLSVECIFISKAQAWASLNDTQRSAIKSQYAAAGINLLVSAFGSTDIPTTSGVDPVATANSMAAWVRQYQLDGIDVDYEDLAAFEKGDGSAEVRMSLQFTCSHPNAHLELVDRVYADVTNPASCRSIPCHACP